MSGSPGQMKDTLEMLLNLTQTAAIIVAGVWTYWLFVGKRQRYPRAQIAHTVTHFTISASRIVLRVTLSIENKGDVLIRIKEGSLEVFQMLPCPDEVLAASGDNDEGTYVKGDSELKWKPIRKTEMPTERIPREIEPDETDELPFEFILDAKCRKVLIYSHFTNETKKESGEEIGWDKSTVYDLGRPEAMSA